jgi:DNA replication and repair protein RecF
LTAETKTNFLSIPKAWLSNIQLTNFRNYTSLSQPLSSEHVVLIGHNGAGKTNLMEAVSMLSPGRGMRRVRYDSMARIAQSENGNLQLPWAVHCKLNFNDDEIGIGTGLSQAPDGQFENSRKLRIDQIPSKSLDSLLEHVRILWLTPSMDGLFTGTASDRRRFMDRLVLAIDPQHGRRVNQFEKAMRQRNKLLEGVIDDAWISGIELQLAELGSAIAAARQELIALLKAMIDADEIIDAFPKANLALLGELENAGQDHGLTSSSELEERYAQLLRDNRELDQRAGRTLIGPHRSDLLVHHREKQMEARLCSTGEQKALLIGLVLAHAKLTATLHRRTPILLLDEVAAHLDELRRAALFDQIDRLGLQAWMTGTEQQMFSALEGRAQVLMVNEGTLNNVSTWNKA